MLQGRLQEDKELETLETARFTEKTRAGDYMASDYDFKRLQRMTKVYWVVQGVLIALLVFMAVNFQAQYRVTGMPDVFINSLLTSLVIQLLIFYPVFRFARGEADNEIASCSTKMTQEQQKSVRQRRLFNDVLKTAIFIFFLIFSFRAPGQLFIQSTIFFSFILTVLSYFQCYNFALKRAMAEKS